MTAIENPVHQFVPAEAAILAELSPLRFDVHNPPPHPVPVWELCGHRIATAGNLIVIQAAAKAGKSAFVGALMAATLTPGAEHLGVRGIAGGKNLLHFDCEQSPDDHHEGMERVLRRAGVMEPPAWLASYRIVELSMAKRRQAFFASMEKAHAEGGLLAVILDGGADLVADPNDSGECFAFVDDLHQRAVRYHCPIVVVIHENPGSETGKTRGHLGSQLTRKAETNLRLVKGADGSTVAYTENSRHAYISKDKGPRFAWDDEAGMHLPCGTIAEERTKQKTKEFWATLDKCFDCAPPSGLQRCQLIANIKKFESISQGGARKQFDAMKSLGILFKTADGLYRRAH